MQDPVSKITRAIRSGITAQTVECLPRKCKALSSKPRSTKREKERKTKRERILEENGTFPLCTVSKSSVRFGPSFQEVSQVA
jgi:hypothetical protein